MISIRPMQRSDRSDVLSMMRAFYDSPAVIHTSSDTVLEKDFEDCVGSCPLLDGYIMEDDGVIAGYAMCAMCYTTEYGGLCVWVEDLYLKPEWRHQGIGTSFFDSLPQRYPDAVRFKLQVEKENENAVAAYRKNGYEISEYFQMTREMTEG